MDRNIDTDRLREDMMDEYGTAMFNASPMAVIELSKIEHASDRELVDLALKEGIDLSDYLE